MRRKGSLKHRTLSTERLPLYIASCATTRNNDQHQPISKSTNSHTHILISKHPMATAECPYEYLLSQYGQHHFGPFVDKLRPSLSMEDPDKYTLVLDIMDAVHFCAILVDDIADRSPLRKNKAAAHVVFGETETSSRAYLVLTRVVNRAMRERPVLAAELLKSLEEIHQGQDQSLVWRRYGLNSFPLGDNERLVAYKRMARLKTGSLFVLLGRLLNDGGAELDDKLARFGWYAQLQNDCKNIYSAEYARNKGSVAEDLRNSELSYPIVVGLITDNANGAVKRALETRSDADIEKALRVLESPTVRNACLQALKEASCGVEELVASWGRRETMSSNTSIKATTQKDGRGFTEIAAAPCNTSKLLEADLAYWTRRCIPMVSNLLKSCGVYSLTDQEEQLRFLKEHVLPNLGPRPCGPESQVFSMATFSGFPLQPSINISNSGRAKVRYTFEPLDAISGTPADPFALGPAQRMLFALAKNLGVWPGWIEALVSAYHPTPQEVQRIKPKLRQYLEQTLKKTTGQTDIEIPEMQRMWVCFIAFDLDGPSQAMKAYFDPKVKEAATGIPSCKYGFQVFRSMEKFGNATAIDMLEQFLDERQSVGAVELIAIDCVPESMLPSARIKVYVHTMSNSFKTVRDYVTLGGRRADLATLQGLSKLRDIWHLLLGEPNGIDEDFNKPLTGFSPMQHRLYFSYEMKPGNSDPAVKVYIPVQNYAPNDDAIVQNYEANFRQCGWPWGKDGAYRNVIESSLGPVTHRHASFLHGGSSFIYSKGKGVYQSIYLEPSFEEEKDRNIE
uniref:Multifunctional aromatic prenyl transferase spdE n=1 Tax=Cordana terrestris TaxID=1293529 RepID=SPDE_CORTS|nr:putative prenyltransferase [Cordana terrestris]